MTTEQKTILLVDDDPSNIRVLNATLKEKYQTKIATSGEKALEIVARSPGNPPIFSTRQK
ncbi:MAG: hypothetical protein VW877_08645 [Pseudomonadaceae bacterium]